MVTLFAGYKLIVLTRMVWSACALAMGIVIGKYRPTKGFKNMAIRLPGIESGPFQDPTGPQYSPGQHTDLRSRFSWLQTGVHSDQPGPEQLHDRQGAGSH